MFCLVFCHSKRMAAQFNMEYWEGMELFCEANVWKLLIGQKLSVLSARSLDFYWEKPFTIMTENHYSWPDQEDTTTLYCFKYFAISSLI